MNAKSITEKFEYWYLVIDHLGETSLDEISR